MEAYETLSLIIALLMLLIAFGNMLIALLAFIHKDKSNRDKK